MKKRISIEGMSCGHCMRHVEEALKEIRASGIEVNLEGKYAVADTDADDPKIKKVIENAGYEVTKIEIF